MITDQRKWTVAIIRETHGKYDQECFYRATVDGVELPAEIRVTGSQLAQFGEASLERWCRRNSRLLKDSGVVDAELS